MDPTILEVIRKIVETADKYETKYFLAGATAREIILRHVFGRPPGRRTLDVDFGIAVLDWNHFETLKAALIEHSNFIPHDPMVQRLVYRSIPPVVVDLIPFGGVEDAARNIAWPSEEDIVMRVIGFSDALESAVLVQLDRDLIVPVVSIPMLSVLKLFAWVDRKHEKRDAADILTILKEYGDAGNEDRLYGEQVNVLESEGYDFELAGSWLLGQDAAGAISEDAKKYALKILGSDDQMKELSKQIIVASGRQDEEQVRRCELLLAKFREGFLKRN
jgi:predicted nucleotidyltransferase